MAASTLSAVPAAAPYDPARFGEAFFAAPVPFLLGQADAFAAACKGFRFDLELENMLHSTDTSIGFNRFASWTLLFLALYALFALMWKLIPGTGLQKGTLPFLASSRCIGTVHCVLVVPLSILSLHRQNPDWTKLEYLGLNTPLEQRVVELSVGYFVADFVHFILFEPDLLMFFHHVFSILMMASAGLCGRGSTCAMAALVQGEITNPFQSSWTVAKAAKANRLLAWLSPLFTFVFVAVRVPLVPLWTVAFINRNILFGPNAQALPKWLIYTWSVMSVLMALGGWLWSYSLIKGLRKFYKNKADAKKNAKKVQ